MNRTSEKDDVVIPASTAAELRHRRDAIVRQHIDAENPHDAGATVATFSRSKAAYDIPAFGADGQRPDHTSVHQMWVDLLSVFPDLHIAPRFWRYGDDHIFVDVLVTGTQQADWAGIPASGRSIETRMAALYEFEGADLVCERVYMDFAEIARQLATAP